MKQEKIRLSDHFSYGRLIRFTIPVIGTMIFTSIYGVVDGFFVSNYVGAVPFAALNLVWPVLMLLSAVGFMFGSGGTALVSMTLGMGRPEKANRIFSLIVYSLIAAGAVLSAAVFAGAEQVSRLLGANAEMLPYCVLYLRINLVGLIFFMLQNLFQSFLITAEKPKLGLAVTVAAGLTNMVGDWLLVGCLRLGLAGAALATIGSQFIGGVIPLIWFFLPGKKLLRLGRTRFDLNALVKTCANGCSEFFSNVSASIVGILYNYQLLHYIGTNGVAAYGVIMYVNFLFVGVFFGYAMGVSPVVGFHFGAKNTDELKSLFRKSLALIGAAAVLMTIASELASGALVGIFVGYDPELNALTVRGFRIYTIAFLFMGFNIFGSAFFTALNDGKLSAILSLSRTLVLQLILIYVLPVLLGADGLWLVVVATESLSILLTAAFLIRFSKKYQYI